MAYPVNTNIIVEAVTAFQKTRWGHLKVTKVAGNAFGKVIIYPAEGRAFMYDPDTKTLVVLAPWREVLK